MSGQSFTSELARANQRDDRADLERAVDLYFHWNEEDSSQQYYDLHSDDLDSWMQMGRDDPERALASVMIAASRHDKPEFLGMVAAGILEDLLRNPTISILDRVVAEARKTARLRWMLAIVFPHAISPDAWNKIEPLLDNISGDDPLPPAPFD